MSLFSDLYVGTSGLQSGQEALNVVAHNITNTDTEGYVRQQVQFATREYSKLSVDITGVSQKQTGLGVFITEVRQVRDRFLDATYREEAGRSGFYDAQYAAIEEVEEILGELDGPNFYNSMDNLWGAIEELVKEPDSEVNQTMFIQYAQSFCETAGNVYTDFVNYQNKLNITVQNDVEKINLLGKTIYDLNGEIRAIEAGKVENANDLRDQRNRALDELGRLCKIQYEDDAFGNVLVSIEGHDFVCMNRVNEMGCQLDQSGFYNVFWFDGAKNYYDADGNKVYLPETAPVFNLEVPISSATDTDVGELKSVILARGDHKGNWTDLESEEAYQAVEGSVMMNIMAEFDGLVRNIVNSINGVFAKAANPLTGYLMNDDGTPLQVFARIAEADQTVPEKIAKTDIGDEGDGKPYYRRYVDNEYHVIQRSSGKDIGIYTLNDNGEYISSSTAWFSAANVVVNQQLRQYPTDLNMVRADGSVDYDTSKAMEDAFQDKTFRLNPELTNPISLKEYYSNMIAQLSNSGNVYKKLKENQDLSVESVEGTRQGNIGVSTDEELSNMIKFQNAYNASSRFINVIDECIEHIITTLGN